MAGAPGEGQARGHTWGHTPLAAMLADALGDPGQKQGEGRQRAWECPIWQSNPGVLPQGAAPFIHVPTPDTNQWPNPPSRCLSVPWQGQAKPHIMTHHWSSHWPMHLAILTMQRCSAVKEELTWAIR